MFIATQTLLVSACMTWIRRRLSIRDSKSSQTASLNLIGPLVLEAPFALSSAQLSVPITVQYSYHVTNESPGCDVSGLLTLLPKIFVSPSARKGKFLAVTKFLYDQSHWAAFESKGASNVLSQRVTSRIPADIPADNSANGAGDITRYLLRMRRIGHVT